MVAKPYSVLIILVVNFDNNLFQNINWNIPFLFLNVNNKFSEQSFINNLPTGVSLKGTMTI